MSKIQWTNKTWNPIRGCSMAKGSETGGCLNCYAARMAARNLPELKSPTTGESFARILPSGPRWTGKVELIEKALELPLRWKKPQRIFVNSMSDLFHEALSDEVIDHVFAVMALSPQHTFQILTKRPERMLEYLSSFKDGVDAEERWQVMMPDQIETGEIIPVSEDCEIPMYRPDWPLKNVWFGVSIENQKTADERIPLLLKTPAAKRFVSYEPALECVNFRSLPSVSGIGRYLDSLGEYRNPGADIAHRLDWVIIGGESGPNARPFDLDWARDTIRECREAGVAVFFKQAGANVFDSSLTASGKSEMLQFKDTKGGDMSEWPEELRVREFPNGRL